jgi:aminobenzoyl-glutamate utilization protein B
VVPAYASSWYYVRARTRKEVDEIRERVIKCAKGAALATETRVKVTRLTSVYNRLPNDGMAELLLENMKLFGAPKVTPADKKRAKKHGGKPAFATGITTRIGSAQGFASSDEANVSWLAPVGVFNVTCLSRGASGHHWTQTAQVKLPFAHRGMLRGAEIMAGAALDLCTDAKRLAAIRAEFKKRTSGFKYDPLVKKRQKIPTEVLGNG